MNPREAYAHRLETRLRRMVREELATARDVDTDVDNSVDNPPRIGANPGGHRGGHSTVESGVITSTVDNPRIRKVESRHRGKLTESELMRGYGLDLEELET